MIPAVYLTGEHTEIYEAMMGISSTALIWIVVSCAVGVGISYTGIWAQSMISATTFLVLVNVNKFAIIFLEVFVMKRKELTPLQIAGASIAILGGVLYGKARELIEKDAQKQKDEKEPIL